MGLSRYQGGADGGDEDVAVLHMRQLMRHHAAQLALAERPQDAGGGGHGGMLRVAAGGKSVGCVFIDQVDAWHGQIGLLRQLLHHAVKLRRAAGVHLLRVVHAQHHLVREPVAEHVHAQREHQRQHHALLAAQQATHGHEQRGDGGHQHGGLQQVEHGNASFASSDANKP